MGKGDFASLRVQIARRAGAVYKDEIQYVIESRLLVSLTYRTKIGHL